MTKKLVVVQCGDGSKMKQFTRISDAFEYGQWIALNMRRKAFCTTLVVDDAVHAALCNAEAANIAARAAEKAAKAA